MDLFSLYSYKKEVEFLNNSTTVVYRMPTCYVEAYSYRAKDIAKIKGLCLCYLDFVKVSFFFNTLLILTQLFKFKWPKESIKLLVIKSTIVPQICGSHMILRYFYSLIQSVTKQAKISFISSITKVRVQVITHNKSPRTL